jgi:4-amino-4-deoxy-L-arabinose transferase-like glycosyltransferase
MTTNAPAPTPIRLTLLVLIPICLLKLVLHGMCLAQYGYFRDELYYLASTYHIDFGYVEHPPLFIWLLKVWTLIFGESLAAMRSLSVLTGTALVMVGGLLARAMGGRLFAQVLAALALAVTPVLLGVQHFYSMNVFDQLFWGICGLVLIPIIRNGERKYWVLLGVVLGLGLMNKISVLFLGAGIGAALLLTPQRRALVTPWPWVAAGIALVMFVPYIIWQATRGFPLLEFMRNATQQKMVNPGPWDFLKAQMMNAGPFAVPIYLAGLIGVFAIRDLRPYRFLVIVFLAVVAILLGSGSNKAYYLSPAYPFLLIPGAVTLDRVFSRGVWRTTGVIYAVVVGIGGMVGAPFAIPLLPIKTYLAYAQTMGITPRPEERSPTGVLPQHFADMFGWEEYVAELARLYHALPAEDQARCGIFVRNYGEAGAIDVLGKKYGLPRALCGHNTYWYWGPGSYNGEVLIMVGGRMEEEAATFESVERIGTTPDSEFSMPYERNRPIYLCRKLKIPLTQGWDRSKLLI